MHDDPLTILGIPTEDWAHTPPTVQQVVGSLLTIIQEQRTQLAALQAQVRDLQAKVGQTSQNSSKPPSSDPPSAPPPPARVPRGRQAGAQPGHPGHHRPLVPPDQVQERVELRPTQCPSCQGALADDLPTLGAPQRTQVWELPEIRPIITEFRQHAVDCPHCHQVVTAPLPPDMPPGGFGPRATAQLGLLRGVYGFSLDDAVGFFGDAYHFPLSPGSVVTSCARVSEALAPVDAAIQAVVHAAPVINADETSWPTETRRGWLWVAVCAIATCFRIHASRGKGALQALLGTPTRGIIGSDRWSAYRHLPPDQRQLCWAHLIRNLRGLAERYGTETRWAHGLLDMTDEVFLLWHLYRGGWIDQVALHQALIPIRLTLRDQLTVGTASPHPKIAGFSRDLLAQWESLWTFSRVEGVEPTNNAAERALRHAVLWRKRSFGSRSAAGCRFVERILSVHATCAQQGRPLLAFLTATVAAAWGGPPVPPLVPPSPAA